MSEKQVKRIIRSIAEQKAPGASIDLWPGIRSQVSVPHRSRSSKLRFAIATFAMVILLAGTVFFLTPQGQAWAQNTFQFITQTESDRKIVPTSQAAPTSVSQQTQEPTIQGVYPTTEPDDQIIDDLTLEEVQKWVDFQIYQPSWLPKGFAFEKALYDQEKDIVTLMYYRSGSIDNAFGLRQEPISSSEICDICFAVGANAHIKEVSVNGAYGEYVVGVWQLVEEDGSWTDEAEWINHPWMQTMIWQENGMAFEIRYMGDPGYLSKANMISIAESIN
jgi:hypothetical protein